MNKLFLLLFIPALAFLYSCKHLNKKDQMPNEWYSLERDTSGYVFYVTCEGNTPYIDIYKDSLTVGWQLEPEKYKIISQQEKNDYYIIKCRDSVAEIDFTVRWLDQSHSIALWKFKTNFFHDSFINNNFKWVMCPLAKKNKFKVVACVTNDSVKSAEMPFLPININ